MNKYILNSILIAILCLFSSSIMAKVIRNCPGVDDITDETYANKMTLALSNNYELSRSNISEPEILQSLTWVIAEEGANDTLLERVAENEMTYTYYRHTIDEGMHYCVYLKSHIDGRYRRVSNIIAYTYTRSAPPITHPPIEWWYNSSRKSTTSSNFHHLTNSR